MTAVILVALMLGAFACSASEAESARVVEIQITREVEVTREVEATREIKVPVKVTREVTREIEVTREVEVTREIPVTVEVTSTPIPSATPVPTPAPTPTVDVRDVDYVRDIEIPEDFVMEAVEVAAAYCDNRTFSVSHDVNDHLRGFFGIERGADECRPDPLTAMAIRSKRMRETHTRYIFKGNKFRECYSDNHNDYYYSQGNRLQDKCGFVDLYPARHSPEYDRERLIVMFEDHPPSYAFEYLLTQDEIWARNQIWRSLIRLFHSACMRNAESTQGRVLYFDSLIYVGHLPNSINDWFHLGYTLPHQAYWGTDGPDVGLCSAYDIKTRAEYEMWDYDLTYFGYLATGSPSAESDPKPGSVDFTQDLAAMRANPPEMPNRFAVE
ncbi:MAG: hypothetical protein F4Y88_08225 [Chloroflexi bacterium]|nr:hypothetical protein [Chloroflexota bacterium]